MEVYLPNSIWGLYLRKFPWTFLTFFKYRWARSFYFAFWNWIRRILIKFFSCCLSYHEPKLGCRGQTAPHFLNSFVYTSNECIPFPCFFIPMWCVLFWCLICIYCLEHMTQFFCQKVSDPPLAWKGFLPFCNNIYFIRKNCLLFNKISFFLSFFLGRATVHFIPLMTK